MAPLEATDDNFEEEVLSSDIPVLVDFWAPWCHPCKRVAPIVEDIGNEQSGKLKVVKLNTDENPAIAQRYGITSIPTLMVYKGGEPVATIIGAKPKPKLMKEIEPFL